jgi:AcrR family transcriptional regulator
MPKPTFINLPEEKRERLVRSAVQQFAALGFAGASLSSILYRARIAKGSFYQYFAGKLELYHWLVMEEAPRRKRAFADPPAEGRDLFRTLEDECVAELRFFRAEPALARIALRVHDREFDLTLSSLFARARAAKRTVLVAALAEARSQGRIRRGVELQRAAIAVTHVLGAGAIDAYLTVAGTDLSTGLYRSSAVTDLQIRRIARALVAFVRGGLTPRRTAARRAGGTSPSLR